MSAQLSNDDLKQTFLLVVQWGSFCGAARAMNLSPTAVKYRIDQLEAISGHVLFDRRRRGVSLTAIGEATVKKLGN